MAKGQLLAIVMVCTISVLSAKSIYDFSFKDIDGKEQSMSKYKGKVLLLTNVASTCAKTIPMYAMLQNLYNTFKDKGFCILACPCNQWMEEQGTEKMIKESLKTFNVTFDFTSKMDVNGDKADPMWKYAKEAIPRAIPGMTMPGAAASVANAIEWNFGMLMFDKTGQPVSPRCTPDTTPASLTSKVKELVDK